MRVLQMIDSLEAGGAERMAVVYANALREHIEGSFLCTTRAEGPLATTIHPEVKCLHLQRSKTLDKKAITQCVSFIKNQKIEVIHAHGTSYFFAFLVKRKCKGLKVIWHNHYGASSSYGGIKLRLLQFCSRYFSAVISVNQELVQWGMKNLHCKKHYYVPNFIDFDKKNALEPITLLGKNGLRVVCLANLKNPKGHQFLIRSFKKVVATQPEATLHLVGKDYGDAYSQGIKNFIVENSLNKHIFVHGAQSNPDQYLNDCSIGVLSSSSEGLPMALLEYGRAQLAVVATDVGQCKEVLQDLGKIVPYQDENAMTQSLLEYLQDDSYTCERGKKYREHIRKNYSTANALSMVLKLYATL